VAGLCRLSHTYNFVDNTHTIQTQTSGLPSSSLHVTLPCSQPPKAWLFSLILKKQKFYLLYNNLDELSRQAAIEEKVKNKQVYLYDIHVKLCEIVYSNVTKPTTIYFNRLESAPFFRLFTREEDIEYTGCGKAEQRGLRARVLS
jgi:hypothetical protein